MATLTLDHHGGDAVPRCDVGDYLRTERSVYVVRSVREVASRVWPDRWRVELERLGPRSDPWLAAKVATGGRRVHDVGPRYGPGERPGQPGHVACTMPSCEGCGTQ